MTFNRGPCLTFFGTNFITYTISLYFSSMQYYAVSTTTYSAKVNASEDGILSSVTTSLSASGNVPSQEEAGWL